MHRPQAVGLRAVMLSLLVLATLPAAAEAGRPIGHGPVRTPARQLTADAFELARTAKQAVRAGTTDERCTGWRSTLFPPQTIRVLQTRGPDAGKVYRDPLDATGMTPLEIPFREYVGIVIAAEWPANYPFEVLRAGAITVKQFAWYYAIVYRGGVDVDGFCYDVEDNATDQWYQPETRSPAPSHLKAIAETWTTHLRKTERTTSGRGRFILTGYRAGANVPCGTDSDSWRIYQHSAYNCGLALPKGRGMNMEQVLRAYIDPRLEIVTPGHHDILGATPGALSSEMGDVSAIVESPQGALVPHIWQASRAGIADSEATAIDIAGPGLLGQSSEDINGDGWDDLVVARKTGPTSVQISVARSDGSGYQDEATGWAGDVARDPDHARLITGDLDGDGRNDAALLFRGAENAHELVVFRRRKGNGFLAPVSWWAGTFDPAVTQVMAGDVNGDGRLDLVLVDDLAEAGRTYRVAFSKAPLPGLRAPRLKLTADDLVGDVVKHVVADVTRDGRDDVLLLVDGATRTRIEVLRSPSGPKPFLRSEAWRSTTDDKLPFDKLKLSVGDLDYDGLMDLVMFRDRGESGTEILAFETNPRAAYGKLIPGPSVLDAGIDWRAVRPY